MLLSLVRGTHLGQEQDDAQQSDETILVVAAHPNDVPEDGPAD